jgi:hypothetical protein
MIAGGFQVPSLGGKIEAAGLLASTGASPDR